ncbi:tetratricopeptide repeat protein [Candidatus Electronema sp. JM]|uniref:tetratricopeptide repeat protein n=1 Tax=Candidatus Electronema sp. JM TaxID=3401571 RepID=UPI003AA7AADF
MSSHFDSKGGGQNIAQGENAIGRQENVTQEVRGDGCIFSGTGDVTVNKYGVPYEAYGELAGKHAVTESALASFFKIMEEQQVPLNDLDSKLREIATDYKALLARVGDDQAAKQAIEAGDYAKAEGLLEDIARHHSLAAAKAYADNAKLQEVQLRYAKAAAYWQKAAALLPEESKKERSLYLHSAAYDLDRIAKYKEALPLYEQSLVIDQELGDRQGEGTTLNNISQIYDARGDYTTALKYLEQSLSISREIGDKAGEGTTLSNIAAIHYSKGDYDKALSLFEQSVAIFHEAGSKAEEGTLLNNISQIYKARGDYATALKYLEQSLRISREIGDKAGEGTTLNNIAGIYRAQGDYAAALKHLEQSLRIRQEIGDKAGEGATLNNISQIYDARGDYATALKYLEQSLSISREIGDKAGEAVTSWNIGLTYKEQGNLAKAEPYLSRAVQLEEEIGHPDLEKDRKTLAAVRALLRGQQSGLFARLLQSMLGR